MKKVTPKEYAEKNGVPYQTVMSWLRRNLIPGAEKNPLPSGGWYYLVPLDAPQPELKPGRKSGKSQKTDSELAHANYFLDLAQKAHEKLLGAEQNTWLDRLDFEHANWRAALDHFENTGSSQQLELAVLLGHFWDIRGYWSEGIEILKRALARETQTSSLKARGLAWLSYLSLRQDDYECVKESASESVSISRAIDDKESLAVSLICLGAVAEVQGHYPEAKALFIESLRYGQELNSHFLIAWAYRGLGAVAELEDDCSAAKDFYLKGLSNSEEIQDLRGMASSLNCLGVVAREQKDYSESRRYHERSLALRQGMADKDGISYCLFKLGLLEEETRQHQTACRFFQKSLALFQELGNRIQIAKALEGVGRMAYASGNLAEAARIHGAADALRALIDTPLSPTEHRIYGQIISSLKNGCPSEWKEGGRWPVDKAITLALSVGAGA